MRNEPVLTEAERQMVADNIGLTRFVVFRVRKKFPFSSEEDLLQDAVVALCRAARSFDPTRAQFSTYAVRCIHRRLAEVLVEDGVIRVTREAFGRTAAPKRKAAAAKVKHALYRQPRAADRIEYPDLDRGLILEEVQRLFTKLPAGDQSILRHRFGLGTKPKTCKTIGAMLGFTKSRVQQKQKAAVARLRELCEGS